MWLMTYKLNLTEVEYVLGFAKDELSPAGCAGRRFLQNILKVDSTCLGFFLL